MLHKNVLTGRIVLLYKWWGDWVQTQHESSSPIRYVIPHVSHDALQHPCAISHATSLSTGSHHPSPVCTCCTARMCLCVYSKSNSISAFEGMIQLRGSRSGGWMGGVSAFTAACCWWERDTQRTHFVLMMFWGAGMSLLAAMTRLRCEVLHFTCQRAARSHR